MKHLIIITLLTLAAATASAQTMRDSTAYRQTTARQCVITVGYGGVTAQYIMTPEEVAAWIAQRGLSSADTTRPLQDGILSHIIAEIGRVSRGWIAARDTELGLVDQDDQQTLAQIRAARAAIRLRYRSWLAPYTVKVPVLEPPIGEVAK